MKVLFFALALFLVGCATTKKTDNKEEHSTETTTKIQVDTIVKIPMTYDSVFARLWQLSQGVQVGQSTVRYDTIRNTVYLTTKEKLIPVKINKETVSKTNDKIATVTKTRKGLSFWTGFGIIIAIILVAAALIWKFVIK